MALLPLNYIWIKIIGFVRPVKQGSWVRACGFLTSIFTQQNFVLKINLMLQGRRKNLWCKKQQA